MVKSGGAAFELIQTTYGRVLIKKGGLVRPEVKLNGLDVGSRFRCDNLDGSWTYGTLIEKNNCRCIVVLSGGQQQVVFDDHGKARRFTSEGKSTVSWPLEVLVEDITMADEDWRPNGGPSAGRREPAPQNRVEDPEERGIHMTTTDAQAKGLNARYHHALKELAKATEGGDSGKMETHEARIAAIQAEAETKGVTLISLEEAEAAKAAEPATEATPKTDPKKAKLKANLDAAGKGKAKGEKKEKKPKSTHDCICGCKRETQGLYAPGHDARVKGMLLKVERGDLKKEDIPEGVRPFVKFTGVYKTEGFKLAAAPVKIPGRDEVENTTLTALEALDK